MASDRNIGRGGPAAHRVGGTLVAVLSLLALGAVWPYVARDVRAWDTYQPIHAKIVRYAPAGPADAVADREGRIDYTYDFDGQRFSGTFPPAQLNRVPPGSLALLRSPHRPGDDLIVYFDPENAAQSMLQPWVDPVNILVFNFGLLCFMGGVVYAVGAERRAALLRCLGACQPERDLELLALVLVALPIYILIGLNASALPWRLVSLLALVAPVVIPPIAVFIVPRWYGRLSRRGEEAAGRPGAAKRVKCVHGLIAGAVCLTIWGIVGPFAVEATRFWGEYAYATACYEETQGTVLVSWNTTSTKRKTRHFIPHVRYTYSVAGREYQGDRVFFGAPKWGESERLAKRLEARYKAGATVLVHYNPHAPHRAVLEKAIPGSRILLTVLVVPFVLLCIALTIGILRPTRARGAQTPAAETKGAL